MLGLSFRRPAVYGSPIIRPRSGASRASSADVPGGAMEARAGATLAGGLILLVLAIVAIYFLAEWLVFDPPGWAWWEDELE